MLALAASVLGVLLGNITLTWFLACGLGLVGVALGLVGIRRARGGGPHGGVALAAVAVGVVAVGLGVAGAILVEDFFSSSGTADAFVLTPD